MRLHSRLAATSALVLACRAGHAADSPALAASLGQMLLGLALVVALLLASLWLLKRVAGPRGGAGPLKVLGVTAVGARERVVMVEVAGKVLVLGVAPGRVNTLHSLDVSDLPGPAATRAGGPDQDLQGRLRRLVERHK